MSDTEVTAAARRLLHEIDTWDIVYSALGDPQGFERDITLVATWALGASAIEHVNCNAMKPCACRCSVCAVPEPAAPSPVPPHDAAVGE